MSDKQPENDDASHMINRDIVQIDIRNHKRKIKEIRDLLIILNYQYENDSSIISDALEIGLEMHEKHLSLARNSSSPF